MTNQDDNGEIAVMSGGMVHLGRYQVEDDTVVVSTSFLGIKATQRGGLPAERVARILLDDLVRQRLDLRATVMPTIA